MSSPTPESPFPVPSVPLIIHRYTDAVEYLADAMMAGLGTDEVQVSDELLNVGLVY